MLPKRKNRMKNFITLCLAILICSGCHIINVSALGYERMEEHRVEGTEPKQSGDFLYQYCEICEGIVIVGYIGNDKVVTVPAIIDETQVKELGSDTFNRNDQIEECILPDNIMLNRNCFSNCTNLKKVNVPKGVTYLISTFSACNSLTDVSLPSTLVDIGENTFNGCSSLKTLEIPESVQSVGNNAFAMCSRLQKVKLPSGLREIGAGAFWGCKRFTEIEL